MRKIGMTKEGLSNAQFRKEGTNFEKKKKKCFVLLLFCSTIGGSEIGEKCGQIFVLSIF